MEDDMEIEMGSQDMCPASPTPSEESGGSDLEHYFQVGPETVEKKGVENGKSLAASLCSYDQPSYPVLPQVESDDWQYVMRRTMQEVIPGLFLGPYACATKTKLEELKTAGITNIVCVRESRERNLIRQNHPDSFQYLVVELEDSTLANIIPHFRIVNPFITSALEKGGKVLVHGSAGISRSVALVIAYIMETHGVTTHEAYKYVQSIRFCSNPNEGFMCQLREYEPIYRAMHVIPRALPDAPAQPGNQSIKRSLDDDDDYQEPGPNKGVFDGGEKKRVCEGLSNDPHEFDMMPF